MQLDNLNIVEILQVGVAGLGFLLAVLAYHLLRKEQSIENPRPLIVNAVYGFMLFSIVLCIIGFVSRYYEVDQERSRAESLYLSVPQSTNDQQSKYPPGSVFSRVEGTWEQEQKIGTDSENPHTIHFSNDLRTAIFTLSKPHKTPTGATFSDYSYRVIYATYDSIGMFLEGESTTNEFGDPIFWILRLKDFDTYYWRRSDWGKDSKTIDVKRVK